MMKDQTQVREYLAEIGKRGGLVSRCELTKSHARQMVAIREMKRAAIKASVRQGELYGWMGTRLGGRPGIEIGDRGKRWPPRDERLVKLS
jgi:hypothetical protein